MTYKESIDKVAPLLAEYAVNGKLISPDATSEILCWFMLNNKSTGEFRQFATNHILHLRQSYEKHGADGWNGDIPIDHKSKNVMTLDAMDYSTNSSNDYNKERYDIDVADGLVFIHGAWFRGRILGCVKYPCSAINFDHVMKCIDRKTDRQRRNLSVDVKNPDHVDPAWVTYVYVNPFLDMIPELPNAAITFVEWAKQCNYEDLAENKITCSPRLTFDILAADNETF